MNCEKAQTWIDAYVDRELDAPQRASMEAHLEACAACRQRLREAQRVTALSRSFETTPPDSLRAKTLDETRNQRSTPMSRIKEILTMKKGMGFRVGLATAIVAAAFAAIVTLVPHPAEARGNAATVLKKMKKAAQGIRAMHSVSYWNEPGTTAPQKIEIWTDGVDLYIDRIGHLEIIRHGRFYEGGKPFNYDPNGTGQTVASGPVNPEFFTVTAQLKMLNHSGADPIDSGTGTLNGRTVRKITIVTDSGTERHTFWVDQGSDLPLRDTVEATTTSGTWAERGFTDYEFIDALDPKLFDNLPPEVGRSTGKPAKPAIGGG